MNTEANKCLRLWALPSADSGTPRPPPQKEGLAYVISDAHSSPVLGFTIDDGGDNTANIFKKKASDSTALGLESCFTT